MRLTEDLLRALCPRPRKGVAKQKVWDAYVEALTSEAAAKLLERYEVTTIERLARFLANGAHESGGFTIIMESGAYSARRILQVFGAGHHSAGVTAAEADRIASLPVRADGSGPRCEALFERVYGLGNPRKARELGNIAPGDGWRYRGVSWMQITGRSAWERYAARIGIRPDQLAMAIHGVHAALLEWEEKGCNKLCDLPREDADRRVRKAINGGYNGMPDVRSYTRRAERLLQQDWPIKSDEAAPADDGTLRLGSEGPTVYWLQQQLTIHGYYVGVLDSHFERETEKQLMAWQVQHGFKPTGVFDPSDSEQRDALSIAPSGADTDRRDVTAAELEERGSRTMILVGRVKKTVATIWAGILGVFTGEATGLQPVERFVSAGEQVQSLVGRSRSLAGVLPPIWVAVLLAVLVISGIAYLVADKFGFFRVSDARSGANMAR